MLHPRTWYLNLLHGQEENAGILLNDIDLGFVPYIVILQAKPTIFPEIVL